MSSPEREGGREDGKEGPPAPSKFVNFPPLLFFAIFLWQQQQRWPPSAAAASLPSSLQGLPFLPCRPQLSQPLLPLLGNKEMEDGRSVGGTGGGGHLTGTPLLLSKTRAPQQPLQITTADSFNGSGTLSESCHNRMAQELIDDGFNRTKA